MTKYCLNCESKITKSNPSSPDGWVCKICQTKDGEYGLFD